MIMIWIYNEWIYNELKYIMNFRILNFLTDFNFLPWLEAHCIEHVRCLLRDRIII